MILFILGTAPRRICLEMVWMDRTFVRPPSITVRGKPSSMVCHKMYRCPPTLSKERLRSTHQMTKRARRQHPKNRKSKLLNYGKTVATDLSLSFPTSNHSVIHDSTHWAVEFKMFRTMSVVILI